MNDTNTTDEQDEDQHCLGSKPSLERSLKPGIFVKTFGCQMNEYDSEKMICLLSSTHRPVTCMEEADLVILNTCSVREKAEQKLYNLLGTLRTAKNKRPEMIVGVSGCVAQQEGIKIIKKIPFVDFVVGTHNLSLVPSLVKAVRNGRGPQVAVDYREEWEEFSEGLDAQELDEGRQENPMLGAEDAFMPFCSVRALIAIQRGCNKNCAFCVVPTTRGSEVSRSPEEIEREVRLKVRLGAREVLLLGQTVNSYGRDLTPRHGFEKLIRKLATIDGLLRIRFTSPHPAEVRPEFIELYGEVPELCPHIHLPLQSGSDRILKLMNRNYRTKRYLEIVESLRKRCPEIAISSDFIVGFPTETQGDFQKTLEVIEEVGYNSSYSFKYSRRPNTKSLVAFGFDEEIPKDIAQERLFRLQSLQDELSAQINSKLIGTQVEVLVEGPKKGVLSKTYGEKKMRGRSPQNMITEIEGDTAITGQIVKVSIEHGGPRGLRGRAIEVRSS